jgi:FAD/FMN-containing dehydrogenase
MPFLPEEVHGEVVILAMLVHAGSPEDGERAIAPFRALATPLADMVREMPYPEIFPPDDPEYRPVAAARTMFVDSIGKAEAELILDRLRSSTAMMAACQLRALGGAMARVPDDATAFAHRQSEIMVNVAAIYGSPDEASVHEDWVAEFAASLRQSDDGMYVNFVGDEDEESVRASYPGKTWERLAAIKRRYDPTNLFRMNQNIPPAAES